jgi:two-component system OmpR family sensor kinase
MHSLRRTLSVRFSFTMLAALLVIALWAYLGARRVLQHELDRGLVATAHLESSVVAAGYGVPLLAAHTESDAFVDSVNRFVVVRDAAGRVLGSNTPLVTGMPYAAVPLAAAVQGGTAFETTTWGGRRVRSVYLGVAHERPGDGRVIQVTASLAPIDAESRQVLLLLLGTVVLGTVATMLGGGWLARSAVAPVAEIAGQANAVAPGAVGQRITAHAEVEEFYELVGVLNHMLERLDRGLLAQRRIIADVGHDLKTPLTAMQGEAEVALRNPRSPEQYQRILASLLEEINHLATISDTLLLLARIEAGDLALHRTETDVRDLVTRAVQRVGQRATDHLFTYAPSGDGAVSAALDGRMISLVLDHLLDNAARHTPASTPVTVSLRSDGAGSTITVEDAGPGVPDDVLPHLFERFYRGDAARGRGAGAGLGLTVAAAIVHAHGGAIAAERAAAGGLSVTIRLPRTAEPATT